MGAPQQNVSHGGSQPPVQRTGETVTVGCRIPNGLVLQLHDLEEQDRVQPDGSVRKIKVSVARSQRIVLNGCAKFRGGERETAHLIIEGAGVTFGVPSELFLEWMRVNADADVVKKGLIFSHRSSDISQLAKERRGELSGMEPLDTKNLPAEFRGKIETGKAA